MKKLHVVSILMVLQTMFLQEVKADIELPALISSNMVLQRNTTVNLWGWADANEKITITASWLEKTLYVKANDEGKFEVVIKTTNSTEPQRIVIAGSTNTIPIENILFGEVWLCSGQSNMFMPIKGFNGQPTYGSLTAVAESQNNHLRLFSVAQAGSKTPLKHIKQFTPWQTATPKTVSEFSAVAYFFGQRLQRILGVPVGLIHTSYSASTIQAWMSTEVLTKYQNIDIDQLDISKKTHGIPTALFNAMLQPLIPYTIKGVLWYQGESNRMETALYKKLFPAMVKDWRARWGLGDFPFYYTQIAPYTYGDNTEFQGKANSAFMREAQVQCLKLIPNSGIVITTDLGDEFCIHPPKKKEVAERLLLNALNQTYGYKTVPFAAPQYDSLEPHENGLRLKFKKDDIGLYSYGALSGFEIAGNDKVFYPAKAKIVNAKELLVSSSEVVKPVAVRYAWRNWVMGTLYGANLLPVSSFRTDHWDDATLAKEQY